MTEAEWLDGTRPASLLYVLLFQRLKMFWLTWLGVKSAGLGERKLRLFACGCARQVWPRLSDDARGVIELCEGHADGRVSAEEVEAARKRLDDKEDELACQVARVALAPSPWLPIQLDLRGWAVLRAADAAQALKGCTNGEDAAQCDLLRDVFRASGEAAVEPAWLAWRGGLVAAVARTLYEEGRFGELPVLADALEEAGCADAEILDHCRSGKEHVRGCWLLDALAGRR